MTSNATETHRTGLIVFECIVISCMAIVGSIGNIFTIIAVATNRRLREPAQYCVVSLAIADLIPCLITDSVYVVSAWHQEWFLPDAYVFCQIVGVFTVLCLEASVMNLTMIAINRYVCIVRYKQYRDIFTPRRTVLMCLVVWVPPVIGVITPIIIGVTPFGFHERMLSCSVEATEVGWWYLTALLLTYIPVAMTVIIFCYIHIYRTVRASRRRIEQRKITRTNLSQAACSRIDVNEEGNDSTASYEMAQVCQNNPNTLSVEQPNVPHTNPNTMRSATLKRAKLNLKKEVRLTVNLFIIFVIFVVCWLPLTVTTLFDSIESDVLWQVVSILALANSSCDPIVYVWRSKYFRQSYKRILRCSLDSTSFSSVSK